MKSRAISFTFRYFAELVSVLGTICLFLLFAFLWLRSGADRADLLMLAGFSAIGIAVVWVLRKREQAAEARERHALWLSAQRHPGSLRGRDVL